MSLTVAQPLTLIEQDSESVTFKTVLQTDKSTWTQYLRLFRRDGAIEVENQVDWQEKHVLAKVLFDCNVLARQALCDTSAGYIARDTLSAATTSGAISARRTAASLS